MTAEEVRRLAPTCTAVASDFRDVFGEAKIERLQEGGVTLGKPDENEYASCFYRGDGTRITKQP